MLSTFLEERSSAFCAAIGIKALILTKVEPSLLSEELIAIEAEIAFLAAVKAFLVLNHVLDAPETLRH